MERYYEIPVNGGKIGIHAISLELATAKASKMVANGCDAEYCEDGGCTKDHYHLLNCRCAFCCADDAEY